MGDFRVCVSMLPRLLLQKNPDKQRCLWKMESFLPANGQTSRSATSEMSDDEQLKLHRNHHRCEVTDYRDIPWSDFCSKPILS